MEKTGGDREAVIGEECHIIGRKPSGSRHDPEANVDLDTYDNLVLLCRNHHKLIDDQPTEYGIERLKRIKVNHEKWVRDTLDENVARQTGQEKPTLDEITLLPRIQTGKELLGVVRGASWTVDTDQSETEEEAQLVSSFLEQLAGWCDVLDHSGPGIGVRAEFYLGSEIQALEESGFLVFGGRMKSSSGWPEAAICILRETNTAASAA